MSRSYKKNPFTTDQRNKRIGKRFANKRVRKSAFEDALQGKSADYKKLYEQYDICDYRWRWSKEDAIKDYYENERLQQLYPTLELFLEYWAKCSKRK